VAHICQKLTLGKVGGVGPLLGVVSSLDGDSQIGPLPFHFFVPELELRLGLRQTGDDGAQPVARRVQ
jgi:hypothetical protein